MNRTDDERARVADLLPLLKLNRAELIQWFTPSTCNLCGRVCETEEDRERLSDPIFCDRGGNWQTKTPRCPWKQNA